MLKRAFITVGIVAVLLTGVLPGGDSCALAEAADHACCAEPAPEPSSSCCSSMEPSEKRTQSDHQTECDCIHAPSTPADVVASTAPPVPDEDASLTLRTEASISGLAAQRPAGAIEPRVRTHPPPPVFLLDCCFLI